MCAGGTYTHTHTHTHTHTPRKLSTWTTLACSHVCQSGVLEWRVCYVPSPAAEETLPSQIVPCDRKPPQPIVVFGSVGWGGVVFASTVEPRPVKRTRAPSMRTQGGAQGHRFALEHRIRVHELTSHRKLSIARCARSTRKRTQTRSNTSTTCRCGRPLRSGGSTEGTGIWPGS